MNLSKLDYPRKACLASLASIMPSIRVYSQSYCRPIVNSVRYHDARRLRLVYDCEYARVERTANTIGHDCVWKVDIGDP